MNVAYWDILRWVPSTLFEVVLLYALSERKYNKNKSAFILIAFIIIKITLELIINTLDPALSLRLLPIVDVIMVLGVALVISKYRDSRAFLAGWTVAVFIAALGILGELPYVFFRNVPLSGLVNTVLYTIMTIILVKYFGPCFLEIMDELDVGWFKLCGIPAVIYVAFYFLTCYPVVLIDRPENYFVIIAIIALMVQIYAFYYSLFKIIKKQYAFREDNYFLKTQVMAVEQSQTAINASIEQLNIYRHDFHHYMNVLSAYLMEDDVEGALKTIDRFNDMMDKGRVKMYCTDITINGIINHYVELAELNGIQMVVRLNFPEFKHVDKIELSIAFSNALQNAINACQKVPPERERLITLFSQNMGEQLIIEFANSFTGDIKIDKRRGLPMSDEAGHGIGSHSLAAFVSKYDAALDYKIDRDKFKLRILINDP